MTKRPIYDEPSGYDSRPADEAIERWISFGELRCEYQEQGNHEKNRSCCKWPGGQAPV